MTMVRIQCLRRFHRVVRAEIAAGDRADGHHERLRPQDGAADDECDSGDSVDDCAEDGFERVHFVDVGHAHGGEHGEVHDADAAAEVAAVDGDEEFEDGGADEGFGAWRRVRRARRCGA